MSDVELTELQLEIVAFLATRPGPTPFTDLHRHVWNGTASAHGARAALRRLRKRFGTTQADGPRLTEGRTLTLEGISCDWNDFSTLVGDDVGEAAAGNLHAALGMVTGPPFAEVRASTFGWAFDPDDYLAAAMEFAIARAAEELACRSLRADRYLSAWAANQGLRANPTDERLTALKLSAERHDPKRVRRTWNDHVAVLREIDAEAAPSAWLVTHFDRITNERERYKP